MEELTEQERNLIALGLQGLVMRQPHVTTEVMALVEKLGLMERFTNNLQSWISWAEVHTPIAVQPTEIALFARLSREVKR